jgi:hypothetical protein
MSAEGRQQLVLPAKIRAYLVGIVERKWTIAERDPRPAVEASPGSLPADEVKSVVSGGPFGCLIDARLDEIDGRLALEVLEDDRMSGPNHYRVWEDGTEEPLENEMLGLMFPADCSPEEAQRIEEAYHVLKGAGSDEEPSELRPGTKERLTRDARERICRRGGSWRAHRILDPVKRLYGGADDEGGRCQRDRRDERAAEARAASKRASMTGRASGGPTTSSTSAQFSRRRSKSTNGQQRASPATSSRVRRSISGESRNGPGPRPGCVGVRAGRGVRVRRSHVPDRRIAHWDIAKSSDSSVIAIPYRAGDIKPLAMSQCSTGGKGSAGLTDFGVLDADNQVIVNWEHTCGFAVNQGSGSVAVFSSPPTARADAFSRLRRIPRAAGRRPASGCPETRWWSPTRRRMACDLTRVSPYYQRLPGNGARPPDLRPAAVALGVPPGRGREGVRRVLSRCCRRRAAAPAPPPSAA